MKKVQKLLLHLLLLTSCMHQNLWCIKQKLIHEKLLRTGIIQTLSNKNIPSDQSETFITKLLDAGLTLPEIQKKLDLALKEPEYSKLHGKRVLELLEKTMTIPEAPSLEEKKAVTPHRKTLTSQPIILSEQKLPQLFYNLIIILDENGGELAADMASDYLAMTASFAIAISEASRPIFVSKSVEDNFFRHKDNAQNQAVARIVKEEKLTLEALYNRPEYNTLPNKDTFFYSLIPIDTQTVWVRIPHASGKGILYIPQSYVDRKTRELAATNKNYENYLKQLSEALQRTEGHKHLLEAHELFKKEYWRLFQRFEAASGQKRMLLDAQKMALNTEAKEKNKKRQALIICGFDPKFYDLSQPAQLPAETNKTALDVLLDSLFTKTQTFGNWLFTLFGHGRAAITTEKTIDPESAIIADLPYNSFIKSLQMLNTIISTRSLLSWSCYQGGLTRNFLEQALRSTVINYHLVSVGTPDIMVELFISPKKLTFQDNGSVVFSFFMSFEQYFKNLEEFFGVAHEESQGKTANIKKTSFIDPFGKSLLSLIPMDIITSAQAFVRFPGIDKIFLPIQLFRGKVKLLTKTMIKKYELEGTAIDAKNSDLVIIAADAVLVPLEMGVETSIALERPVVTETTRDDEKNVIMQIKQDQVKKLFLPLVTTTGTLINFIAQIFKFFGPFLTRICIKQLISSDSTYENVVIQGQIPGKVTVKYTKDSTPYKAEKMFGDDRKTYEKEYSTWTFDEDDSAEAITIDDFDKLTNLESYLQPTFFDYQNQAQAILASGLTNMDAVMKTNEMVADAAKKKELTWFDAFLLKQRTLEMHTEKNKPSADTYTIIVGRKLASAEKERLIKKDDYIINITSEDGDYQTTPNFTSNELVGFEKDNGSIVYGVVMSNDKIGDYSPSKSTINPQYKISIRADSFKEFPFPTAMKIPDTKKPRFNFTSPIKKFMSPRILGKTVLDEDIKTLQPYDSKIKLDELVAIKTADGHFVYAFFVNVIRAIDVGTNRDGSKKMVFTTSMGGDFRGATAPVNIRHVEEKNIKPGSEIKLTVGKQETIFYPGKIVGIRQDDGTIIAGKVIPSFSAAVYTGEEMEPFDFKDIFGLRFKKKAKSF